MLSRKEDQLREKYVGGTMWNETALKEALQGDRFRAAYQPIVEVNSGRMVANEALARLVREDGSLATASEFIGELERLRLTHRLDHHMACSTIRHCAGQVSPNDESIAHFVNISADLLRHGELVQDILNQAVLTCTSCFSEVPEKKPLVIEITERELLDDIEAARAMLAPFLDFGLRLAIDDFGSGYSSLLYLADLPITFLKLEGQLVRRAPHEAKVRKILKGVQALAHDLELTTIGEFVEDEATLACVRDLGIDWAQGSLFGQPQLARA